MGDSSVDDVEPGEPPNECPRDGCDERFWFAGSVEIHLARDHETPDRFVSLEDV